MLRPWRRTFVELCGTGEHEALRAWFHRDTDWPALCELLRALGVARLHVHHVQGLPPAVLSLGHALACPWDVTLHDYFPLCPQYQLTDASGRYCGEPDAAGCARCLAATPPQWPMDIGTWRAWFGPLLEGASRVIAPSADAAKRVRRYFPAIEPVVWPHAESRRAAPARRKVLVLGGLSPSKGMAVVEACARDAQARDLPLDFRVVGPVAWPIAGGEALRLSFVGEFPEGSLPALLERERGDLAFFPAQWPETYSYTLSAALDAGLPIVATNLGAFAERLAGRAGTRIVDWDTPAGRLNDLLLEQAGGTPAGTPAIPAGDEAGAYRERYLAGIRPRPARLPLPGNAGLAQPPEEWISEATLEELFNGGVGAGNGSALSLLALRTVRADREIAEARQASARLSEARLALEQARERLAATESRTATLAAERDAWHERATQLEHSTSWRLTAPLRALSRLLRRP